MEITKTNSNILIQFAGLLLIAFLAPFIGNQFLTGTIVNATLILSFFLLGYRGAILICFLPSVISLSLGFMPMAIMLPFIMLGNIILVSSFKLIKNYYLALFSGGVLKTFLLFLSASVLISNPTVLSMMSWPQMLTAISGGFLAYLIKKKLDF
ncbi:MAG: hypothetical protein WC446_01690 [Candidatus Paceibacterota bacterium]|jgi:hypothetical protein